MKRKSLRDNVAWFVHIVDVTHQLTCTCHVRALSCLLLVGIRIRNLTESSEITFHLYMWTQSINQVTIETSTGCCCCGCCWVCNNLSSILFIKIYFYCFTIFLSTEIYWKQNQRELASAIRVKFLCQYDHITRRQNEQLDNHFKNSAFASCKHSWKPCFRKTDQG